MTPSFLCWIILAMPLAIAAYMALPVWAERLNATAGDGVADVEDDSTLFR
jgi:hypothetical protein